MYSDYVKLEPGKSPLYPDLAKTLDFAVAAPSAPPYPLHIISLLPVLMSHLGLLFWFLSILLNPLLDIWSSPEEYCNSAAIVVRQLCYSINLVLILQSLYEFGCFVDLFFWFKWMISPLLYLSHITPFLNPLC
jgi:hypothetical protein